MVLDRNWDVLMTNEAMTRVLGLLLGPEAGVGGDGRDIERGASSASKSQPWHKTKQSAG